MDKIVTIKDSRL